MSLARHAKSAVLWNASFNLLREVVLRVGSIVIFRRLLDPADYGVFNFINGVLGFIGLFAFNNFVAHTVQVRDEREVHWQLHFTAGGFFQLPLCALTNLVALALRWFPQYAEFAPMLHVMSLTFLFDWPCELRRKMLEREFDWKRLRILHALALVVAFLVQVNLALVGCGAYVLLLPVFVLSLPFIYDLFVRERWRPDWSWSWDKYQPAWRFGWTRVASGLAFGGRKLIEPVVIIAVLGKSQLGIFGGALGLAQVLCQGFAEQLLYAIYGVLTRVNPDSANVTRVNALVLRVVAWVTIPMATISSALAGPLLLTAYGRKWTDTIPLLPWAMVVGAAVALGQTANTLLLSKHKLKHCLAADILLLIGTLLALGLALPGGLKTYLLALALVQGVMFVVMLVWLVQCECLKLSGVNAALLPASVASSVALSAVFALEKYFDMDATRFAPAAICGVVFGVIYLGVLRGLFVAQLHELARYFPGGKIVRRILILGE